MLVWFVEDSKIKKKVWKEVVIVEVEKDKQGRIECVVVCMDIVEVVEEDKQNMKDKSKKCVEDKRYWIVVEIEIEEEQYSRVVEVETSYY